MTKKYIYLLISSLSFAITLTLAIIFSSISILALTKKYNNKKLLLSLGVIILAIFLGYISLDIFRLLISDYFNLLNNILDMNHIHMIIPVEEFPIGDSPVDPLPGVKCPKCLQQGIETWVLPGKHCPRCGHPC